MRMKTAAAALAGTELKRLKARVAELEQQLADQAVRAEDQIAESVNAAVHLAKAELRQQFINNMNCVEQAVVETMRKYRSFDAPAGASTAKRR
jgi:hypothetical protein